MLHLNKKHLNKNISVSDQNFGIDIETQGIRDLLENKDKFKELYINFIGEEAWKDLCSQPPRPRQELETHPVQVKLEMDKMMEEQLKKLVQETHLTLKENIKNLSL